MRNVIISMAIIAIFLEISGLIWSAKGDRPSETYTLLTQTPEKHIHTALQNGYFMMVGFAASSTADPVQTGYDIWMEADTDRSHRTFNYRKAGRSDLRIMIDAGEAFPAWTASDPLAAFHQPDAMFRLSLDRYVILLNRYTRLLTMPVEDWGFGHIGSPRLEELFIIHRLYVAAGFAHRPSTGLARLQRELHAWRTILAEAKTLSVKTMALLIVDDDIRFVSKLLASTNKGTGADHLLPWTAPLTKEEYTLRWPIQNQLALGITRGHTSMLDLTGGAEETIATQKWLAKQAEITPDAFRRVQHPMLTTMLGSPFDSQRMWETYAAYYDLTIRATESLHSPLPKLQDVARSSQRTLLDRVFRPLEFEPDWETFSQRLMETDARLRLTSLQILLHRPSAATTVPNRLAEVGPRYYDPFTGMPMLWSETQRVIYSIGKDRLDDGGDSHFDIVIPGSLGPLKHPDVRRHLRHSTVRLSNGQFDPGSPRAHAGLYAVYIERRSLPATRSSLSQSVTNS